MSEFWNGRAACLALEGDYIQRNYPPVVVPAFMAARRREEAFFTSLYAGRITFADFIRRSEESDAAAIAAADAARAPGVFVEPSGLQGFDVELQRNLTRQADQDLQRLRQADRDQEVYRQMNRPVITTCNRLGGSLNCIAY